VSIPPEAGVVEGKRRDVPAQVWLRSRRPYLLVKATMSLTARASCRVAAIVYKMLCRSKGSFGIGQFWPRVQPGRTPRGSYRVFRIRCKRAGELLKPLPQDSSARSGLADFTSRRGIPWMLVFAFSEVCFARRHE
jgi:hypothetical protein